MTFVDPSGPNTFVIDGDSPFVDAFDIWRRNTPEILGGNHLTQAPASNVPKQSAVPLQQVTSGQVQGSKPQGEGTQLPRRPARAQGSFNPEHERSGSHPAPQRPGSSNQGRQRSGSLNPAYQRPGFSNPAHQRSGSLNLTPQRPGSFNPVHRRSGSLNPAPQRPESSNPNRQRSGSSSQPPIEDDAFLLPEDQPPRRG